MTNLYKSASERTMSRASADCLKWPPTLLVLVAQPSRMVPFCCCDKTARQGNFRKERLYFDLEFQRESLQWRERQRGRLPKQETDRS